MLDIISRYATSLSGDIAEKMVLHPAYPAYPVYPAYPAYPVIQLIQYPVSPNF
jgi:hypothetical protein